MGDLTNIKILCREIIKEVEERDTKISDLQRRKNKVIDYINKILRDGYEIDKTKLIEIREILEGEL